jgi:hypothetical protein
MNAVVKTILATLLTYSTHFGISQLYTSICIPEGFYGYIQGFMTMGSPLCSSLLTVMTHTQTTYGSLIITSLSGLLIDILTKLKKEEAK